MSGTPFILYIPEIALEKIFSFLTYDEIAKNRIVCKKFNEVGGRLLSRGFIQVEKRHAAIYKKVKSLLPRRESERKVHPLSRHCDILQAVETRISMLNMTYMKYIECNILCFIPGKVLDEIINVLSLVENDFTPPRTHQLLQELRDLSSMAMEHFDEHILPKVKYHKDLMEQKRQALLATTYVATCFNSKAGRPPALFQHANALQKIKKQFKTYKHHITYLNRNTQKLMLKIKRQNARIKAQSLKIKDQERKVQEQAAKLQEQEATIADIKKHLDEWDQKCKDITAELIRAREDALLTSSTSTKTATITRSLSPPKFFKPNIRPRISQILPKNYTSMRFELERKRKSNLLPDIPVKITRNLENEDETKTVDKLQLLLNNDKEKEETETTKSNFSYLIENLIKAPLTSIKSRKRKITEDIDLK